MPHMYNVCVIIFILATCAALPPGFGIAQETQPPQKDAIQPLAPTNREEQHDKGHGETTEPEGPQPKPAQIPVTIEGPVTVINQPNPEEKERNAQDQSKSVGQKFVDDLLFNPSQWPNLGTMIAAGLAAGFAYAAYCAANRQATAAESALRIATTPRLYIDHVRAENLVAGKEPVFLIKIMNSGPVAAEQVAINIRVEADIHYDGAKYTGGDNVIFIPANGFREYFIKVTSVLSDAHIEGFNKHNWRLGVSGYFEHGGTRTQYSYKYYPYDDPRPPGVPQFIPGDFHTSRTTLKNLGGVIKATATLSGSLTNEKEPPPKDGPSA